MKKVLLYESMNEQGFSLGNVVFHRVDKSLDGTALGRNERVERPGTGGHGDTVLGARHAVYGCRVAEKEDDQYPRRGLAGDS